MTSDSQTVLFKNFLILACCQEIERPGNLAQKRYIHLPERVMTLSCVVFINDHKKVSKNSVKL